jgi:hypothetical protein
MLLYTRKRILDREFGVESCDALAELTEILSRAPLDLVLICRSVPDAECEEVIEIAFRCGDGKLEGASRFAERDPRNARSCCPSKHASGMRQRRPVRQLRPPDFAGTSIPRGCFG